MDLHLSDGTAKSSRRRAPGEDVMEWVSGAVMTMSADLWRRVGGFDEDYFLYWEDIDFCRRVHEVGGTIRVDESVTAFHDEGGTQEGGRGRAKSETYYYFNIRNRSLYARKWLPPAARRRWLRSHATQCVVDHAHGRPPAVSEQRASVARLRAWNGGGVPSWHRRTAPLSSGLRSGTARAPSPAESTGSVVRVLESFPPPQPSTNPYITQLLAAMQSTPGLEVECWSWKAAILGQHDVFHTHWTESLIEKRGLVSHARPLDVVRGLSRTTALHSTPVVRTVHNLDLPA